MTPSYQRKGGELEGFPSPISGPNKKDTLDEGEETPSEKTAANVTEEDDEDVLPPNYVRSLRGPKPCLRGCTKKIMRSLRVSKPRLRARTKKTNRAPDR